MNNSPQANFAQSDSCNVAIRSSSYFWISIGSWEWEKEEKSEEENEEENEAPCRFGTTGLDIQKRVQ